MRRLGILSLCLWLLFGAMTVYAGSLDDLVNQNQGQTGQQSNQDEYIPPVGNGADGTVGSWTGSTNSSEFSDLLKDASQMGAVDPNVMKVLAPAKKIVGLAAQVIMYATVILMTFRVALDLFFITFAFSRKFLANGHVGIAPQDNSQQGTGQQPGMVGGGMMGNSPYGAGRYGGGMVGGDMMGNSPYGAGRYGGGMAGQQGMQGQQAPGNPWNLQIVSDAALNAVAAAKQLGSDGKPGNPYKIYAKDMTVMCIVVPILLVLAVSGALTSIGLAAGDAIVNGIAKLVGAM